MDDNQIDTSRDYGLKISQPFYDAATADDTNLLFSSSWPSLSVAFETTFTMEAFAFDLEIKHNLGFPPLAIATRVTSDGKASRPYWMNPNVTKNRLYFGEDEGLEAQVHVKCFNVDLSKDKTYPTLTGKNVDRKYDPDYGIKMSKDGKSIDSKDMRDFMIHSRCQTPMLLTVKTEKSMVEFTSSGGVVIPQTITYRNQRNAFSWVFGYAVSPVGGEDQYGDSIYIFAPYSSQAFPGVQFDDGAQTVILTPAPEKPAALVVLRDPLFAPDTTEVVYG